MLKRRITVLTTLLTAAAFILGAAKPPPPPTAFEKSARAELAAIWQQAATAPSMTAAAERSEALFQLCATWAPDDAEALLLDTWTARWTMHHLDQFARANPKADRAPLLKLLQKNPALARELSGFVHDRDAAKVYLTLDKLRAKHGDGIAQYPALATAIAYAHQSPIRRRITDSDVTSGDPCDLFAYFVRNQQRLYFGVRDMPPELLEMVVDTTAKVDELEWALDTYGGQPRVGDRFKEINYDRARLRQGTPLKTATFGFTLPNIKKYGGICGDQAYFAANVGKAIGIPSVWVSAHAAEMGHAWVGYLEVNNHVGEWDFDTGRYKEYKNIRGTVNLAGRTASDSDVAVLAEMISITPNDRLMSTVLADMAKVCTTLQGSPIKSALGGERKTPHDGRDVQPLLRASLNRNTACPAAWALLTDLSTAGKLTESDKSAWADGIMKLCSKKYMYFCYDKLEPMIVTIKDVFAQQRLLDTAFNLFKEKRDLAARVMMKEAGLAGKNGDPNRAGRIYMEIIDQYIDDGPFAIAALAAAEKQLMAMGRDGDVPALYLKAWQRAPRPSIQGQVATASNWYEIGKQLAHRYLAAGFDRDAAGVEQQLSSMARD